MWKKLRKEKWLGCLTSALLLFTSVIIFLSFVFTRPMKFSSCTKNKQLNWFDCIFVAVIRLLQSIIISFELIFYICRRYQLPNNSKPQCIYEGCLKVIVTRQTVFLFLLCAVIRQNCNHSSQRELDAP